MYSKFLAIDSEKQHRIINAALDEFAKKGYNAASTNEIVKASGISKGLLFHYFRNKKYLFLFLYDYCINETLKEFYEYMDMKERDFFKKLKQVLFIKMELVTRHPDIFKFLEVAYMETSSEIKSELDEKNTSFMDNALATMFQDIDASKFKDDIDVSKIVNIVFWTFEGFTQQLMKQSKLCNSSLNYDEGFKEADVYLEILKSSFYKKS